MNNLRDISTIELYLQGRMTQEEMEDVEIRILLDPDFRQEFESARILIHGIKESARQTTIREKIQHLENASHDFQMQESLAQDEVKILSLTRTQFRILSAVAAAVVLILLFVNLPFFSPGNTSPEQLFAQNFEVSANIGLQTKRSNQADRPASEAYRAYDDKNYGLSAQLFESIIDQSESRLTDLYHLANCYLVLEKWSEAIAALEEVAQSNSSLAENAQWYLALAYVRTGEYQKAKPLLEALTKPKDRVKKARKILRQIH